jgi:hypothetical protein
MNLKHFSSQAFLLLLVDMNLKFCSQREQGLYVFLLSMTSQVIMNLIVLLL